MELICKHVDGTQPSRGPGAPNSDVARLQFSAAHTVIAYCISTRREEREHIRLSGDSFAWLFSESVLQQLLLFKSNERDHLNIIIFAVSIGSGQGLVPKHRLHNEPPVALGDSGRENLL